MRFFSFLIVVFTLNLVVSCNSDYIAKPRGFFRIDFQEKSYRMTDSAGLPYRFETPEYSKLVADKDQRSEPYWVNLKIPEHKAEVNISYKKGSFGAINHVDRGEKNFIFSPTQG